MATKVAQLSIHLDGELFGVGSTPSPTPCGSSVTPANLRQPPAMPDAPTVTDTALTMTAVGYTDIDDAAGTATTLFAIDSIADRVAFQYPAEAGTLAPTGGLGVEPARTPEPTSTRPPPATGPSQRWRSAALAVCSSRTCSPERSSTLWRKRAGHRGHACRRQ